MMKKKARVLSVISAVALAGTQFFSAVPAFAAETGDYVYGTVNLPFADYYYGELNDVAENAEMQLSAEDPTADLRADGYCDAVTSATMSKAKNYECTYWESNYDESGEEISTTIYGIIDVSVAIPTSLYTDALDAIAAGESCSNQLLTIVAGFTENADQTEPAEYKVLNGDGTLTEMRDAVEADVITDAEFEVITNDTYGSYQININGVDTPERAEMEGVVITMTDGSKYAMLHEDNLWFKTQEIAWAVVPYTVHGNALKYACFEDTVGKTVESVKYIVRGGADQIYTTETYLPILHDGTVTAENASLTDGVFSVELADLPDDYDPVITSDADDAVYADGVITFDGSAMLPGSYTVTVSDGTGVYASISTTLELTTSEIPVTFDAATNTIVAADGVSDETYEFYLGQMTKATVNGTTYTLSGRNSTKVISTSTGEVDTTLESVFPEPGTYEISVIATGYSNDFTFTIEIGETAAAGDLGDMNGDGAIDPTDAYLVLTAYAEYSLSGDYGLDDAAIACADIDGDGAITSNDAYDILVYYATESLTGSASWDEILG